jgi:tRNA-binding protein
MKDISWTDFEKVELRVGKIIEVKEFTEARVPAYILKVDFGPEIGLLKSSARLTNLYEMEDLLGMQVIGVVNFPPKQIGPIRSECLITGFYQPDGSVVLAVPERECAPGSKLA